MGVAKNALTFMNDLVRECERTTNPPTEADVQAWFNSQKFTIPDEDPDPIRWEHLFQCHRDMILAGVRHFTSK